MLRKKPGKKGLPGPRVSSKGQKDGWSKATNRLRGDSEMKKSMILLALAFALGPAAAFATPTPAQQASKDCASLRAKTGATAFAQAFGSAGTSNAFGKCVSKFTQVERANSTSANSLCSAEQADTSFAAAHGGKTFVQFYGKGNDRNAFGQCVSLKTTRYVKNRSSHMD